jgi:hypothetical protein
MRDSKHSIFQAPTSVLAGDAQACHAQVATARATAASGGVVAGARDARVREVAPSCAEWYLFLCMFDFNMLCTLMSAPLA